MREIEQIKALSNGESDVLDFSSRKLTNAELISGIIARHPNAARQFHIRYSARISRWVWRLMGSDSEHEDLVQQVLVQVLSSIHSLKDPEALDAWIRCIAIRVVRDELRKRKNKRFHLRKAIEIEDDVSQDPNSPWKQAHIQSFYNILDNLSPDDRIVFVLKHLEGYTNDQIAEYCGYSISTAKRRLERARSRFLKDAMQDYMLMSLAGGGDDTR
ncbi:MAG: sigma-70 family RNA polymerase sigma factor [Deltaproteobacteria bacterium]|nr:sigma-70 family RNA polymerase sigma factor [Deltaproteobacteria bacterium]